MFQGIHLLVIIVAAVSFNFKVDDILEEDVSQLLVCEPQESQKVTPETPAVERHCCREAVQSLMKIT